MALPQARIGIIPCLYNPPFWCRFGAMKRGRNRIDYEIIADLVEQNARVLDLGCGDGELLDLLAHEKHVTGQGIEIDEGNITRCTARGVNVIHGNLDEGLADFQTGSFDYVVLNQTLQVVMKPDYVLKEMVRVGKKGIVGFPNFAYLRVRLQLMFTGLMPTTPELPYQWYNTPNIHLLTVKDFERFAAEKGIEIIKRIFIRGSLLLSPYLFPNLLAKSAIYVIKQKS